ncbi:ParB N-terminal domain-containing protein [Flavobacterium sp. RHBU_24]|uniref:ParB N-terminal domain-containing protein n=1 Tax=Flavobacterium sp. RHBU_24 TaxID=3391185 RepID=UPI00398539E5
MENLAKYLSKIIINIDQILLDPNNPRFAELGDSIDLIPETRFAESKIQKDAFDKMKSDKFEVSELRDTIKTIGFLPMDKIVVREWRNNPDPSQKKYVVVEGNRRVSALKWLIDLHNSAKETFNEDQLENFKELEVLLLDQDKAPDSAIWILPGLRHVSGIKEWGPYQKARAVFILRESGASPQEAAQSLGLSTRGANSLWRSFLALEQMKNDEEFGEYSEPKMYSYFEEIFKKPEVRLWLEWDDNDRKFKNYARLREMYSWMVGEQDDEGNLQDPKLPEAKSIRELGPILNDETALSVFRSPNGTLLRARARYEADHPEDWHPTIIKADSILTNLSADALKKMTPEEMESLIKLKDRIKIVIEDRDKLLK